MPTTAPQNNGVTLNQFNDALRASPAWQAFMQRSGQNPASVRLSDSQRQALQRELEGAGMVFPRGMEIDPAGNINQDQGMSRLWANPWFRWSVIGGAALATMGAAGWGPLAGVMGGGGSGAVASASSLTADTALRYGLQYGLPTVAGLIGTRMQTTAQREGDREMADYYRRALDAQLEEQRYQRGWNEEDRRYGRAKDDYSRLSDEERLWYDRAQTIRDKNYGYQQYGNFVETLEPYRVAGVSATDRLSRLIGGPSVPSTGSYLNLARTPRDSVQAVPSVPERPTWTYTANRPTWNYQSQEPQPAANTPVNTSMPVNGGPQTVLMEAPTGQRRDVPIDQVPFFEARGARRIA